LVYVGGILKLDASVSRAGDDAPKTTKIIWKSNDEKIATVSKDGKVKGISAGKAEIIACAADDEKIFAAVTVTVRASVTEIKLSETNITLLLGKKDGGKSKLECVVYPQEAYNKTVTWTSSNSEIVKVDQEGNIQAVKPGKAVITVKSEDKSVKGAKTAKCNVIVNQAVRSINLKEKKIQVGVNKTASISAEALPANATQKKLAYSSSATSIATVSEKGIIKGIKAGECIIKVTSTDGSGVEAVCNVSVNQLVTGITLRNYKAGSTWNLMEGDRKTISYTTTPKDATNKTIRWTSSNGSVAGLSLQGNTTCIIEAKKGGDATITGTTKDGSNVKAVIKVHVEPKMALQFVDLIGYTEWGYHSFIYKLKNVSKNRTVDGLTVKYWAEDVYRNKLRNHGFAEYEVEETLNVTIKPGQTKKTKRFYAYGFSDAKYIYLDIVKVHFTDGTTIYNHSNDFNRYFSY